MGGEYSVKEKEVDYSLADGYETPEVGSWAEQKYMLFSLYNRLFATGMKNKWETRVYIDLCTGPGKVQIRNTNRILLGSPLIALTIPDPYDLYIFCDIEKKNIESLKARVSKISPTANIQYVIGDANAEVKNVLKYLPKPSKSNKVLSFCFVDPYSLNIDFKTIEILSQQFMDFLILLALPMDANRNESVYVKENQDRIDKFLGIVDWRERWGIAKNRGASFINFLAKEFSNQMVRLDYLDESINKMIPIRSDKKRILLYYLAFYSRSKLGFKFWDQVQKYKPDQSLFD